MKSLMYLIIAIFVFSSFENLYSQEYSHPKSIVYDAARDRYLISNILSGQILALSNTQQLSVFIDGQLTNPRGMQIVGDTLYVVDVSSLRGFSLVDGAPVFEYLVEGATKLVDITVDAEKNLFMTDIQQKKMFIYSLIDGPQEPYVFTQSTYPNGIIYDKQKLYVTTYWDPAQVIVFDLEEWRETKYDFLSNKYFDGIVTDGNGNFYIASWEDMGAADGKGKILKFNESNITAVTEFQTGLSGPGDLYYNSIKGELAVPNYTGENVVFFPVTTNVFESNSGNSDFEIQQSQNNSEIIIKFKKGFNISLPISVYNLFGQCIVNNMIVPNQREFKLNTGNLDAGIYFIRINDNISKLLITK